MTLIKRIFGFLAFSLFIMSISECHPKPYRVSIQWSDNDTMKLTWKDFQGKKDKESDLKASTYVFIDYNIIYSDSIKFIIDVPCYFVQNLSWSKEKKKGSDLLKHEQLYFDMAELIARKIRKEISNHVSYSNTQSTKFLDSINKLYYEDEFEELGEVYAEETNYGINKKEQLKWQSKIKMELEKMKRYSNTIIEVRKIRSSFSTSPLPREE